MPFAVWCTNCKPHETIIGQGVRFNAEKKKIGNYYSTPIYSFRLKHTVCGGWIEIRTDPANTAYVVHEGGRKRDTGDNKELQPGEIAIRLPGQAQDPAEKDPFAKLEGKVEDKQRARTESGRILELQERQARDWDDPYAQSKRLRKTFRTERKGLEKLDANREALKEKMSLGIELADEIEEDRQRAGLVDFGDNESLVDTRASQATRLKPMFERQNERVILGAKGSNKGRSSRGRTRTADAATGRRISLRHELTGNTRAVVDPFLNDPTEYQDIWKTGLKRKKTASVPKTVGVSNTKHSPSRQSDEGKDASLAQSSALVSYASDSE